MFLCETQGTRLNYTRQPNPTQHADNMQATVESYEYYTYDFYTYMIL